ncbi:MAG TPA: dihydrofolate reductase family protein [Solirubrobacteraceae bacterium]|jgi:dihydrofolate reductase|nr:dihydrofolate reductase family protein [Solirubrobacteraceae bacterium]
MRELIVTEFVSLDGVMEAPGGEAGYPHAGWVGQYFTDELGAYKQNEQLAADILVLGRRTYETFVGAWPHQEGPMADKINTMSKLVASTTLGSSDWAATTVVGANLEDAVRERKQQDGGPILVAGSRSVVHALLDGGLVDQINLQVFPLVLGSGKRVYPDRPEPIRLGLESSRTLGSGVVLQSYRVTG